jgi:hypothetical protein
MKSLRGSLHPIFMAMPAPYPPLGDKHS